MSRNQFLALQSEILPLRERLIGHVIYRMVNSLERLRTFMEHHVFAVWDFMSLLKALQIEHTSIGVPWLPKAHPMVARFVNEIVLGEESDEDGCGGYISHFELYRQAMQEIGASTGPIDSLISSLNSGLGLEEALANCGARTGAAQFVRVTWSFVAGARSHCIAAAFSLGREDVIPDMFRRFVDSFEESSRGSFKKLRYYLARHIEVDEGSHGPMANKTICELCGSDAQRWREATEAAFAALSARVRLWDSIVEAIEQEETGRLISSGASVPAGFAQIKF